MSSGRAAIRTWLVTAPPFWAIPNWSTVENAMALEMGGHGDEGTDGDDPATPDPGDKHAEGATVFEAQTVRLGQGGEPGRTSIPDPPRRGLAPCTVTKLGQKPSTQEKSLLQADWSI